MIPRILASQTSNNFCIEEPIAGETPFVSVIMINFNGKNDLANCLPSVFKTNYPNFEVIVVDNGSTDGSVKVLKELSKCEPRLKIVQNSKNLGFAPANNIALKYVDGDLIALLNCDTIVSPNWLMELVKAITTDNTIGIVQSKLLCLYNPEIIDSTGDLVHPSGSAISRGMGEKDVGQYDTEQEIFSARGAAIIIRREIIDKVGLFDPNYFMSYEDIDFSWRTRLAGYRVTFAPNSIVYHKGFDMYNETYTMKMYNTFKNHYMTLIKNYEIGNVLRFTPQFMVLNFVKILSSLAMSGDILARFVPFNFRLKLVSAVVRAPFYVIVNFPAIWSRRMNVQQKRRVPDEVLLKAMSRISFAAFMLNTRATQLRKSSEYLKAKKSKSDPPKLRTDYSSHRF